MHWRPSLTTRLTLAASAASLLPFAVGATVFALAPADMVANLVHADQDRALRVASAELSERRSALRERAAELPDERARKLIAGRDEDALRAWFGDRARPLRIEFRTGTVQFPDDGPVAAYAALDGGSGSAVRGVAVIDELTDAELRAIADDAGFDLAYARGGEVVASTQTAWGARLEPSQATDGTPIMEANGLVARSQPLDPAAETLLVAMADGSRAELLLHSRGAEIGIVLVLLVGIGLSCGVGAALVIDRALRRIAHRAERLAQGDFSSRLPVHGHDAGAVVARSINELSSELQARIGHLQLAFDQLDRTLEGIEDGVCLWSADGVLQVWNRAAERLTHVDVDAAQAGDAPPARFLREQRRPGRRRVLLPLRDGRAQLAVDLVVNTTRDGGVLQVFHDATRALSLEQARQNFLVTAAHELRTPLVSILGFSATLVDPDVDLGDTIRSAAIHRIHEESLRMREIVERFFESSLLATDRIDVASEATDLAAVVAAAIDRAVPPDAVVHSDVPSGLEAWADPTALRRVLAAVLDNAVKYGDGQVEITSRAADDSVALCVTNSGGGIPERERDFVFEPFYRVDPEMRSNAGGSGLGLYMARRLTEAMGGSVELDDLPDGRPGLTVRIVLPAVTKDGGAADRQSDEGSRTRMPR